MSGVLSYVVFGYTITGAQNKGNDVMAIGSMCKYHIQHYQLSLICYFHINITWGIYTHK